MCDFLLYWRSPSLNTSMSYSFTPVYFCVVHDGGTLLTTPFKNYDTFILLIPICPFFFVPHSIYPILCVTGLLADFLFPVCLSLSTLQPCNPPAPVPQVPFKSSHIWLSNVFVFLLDLFNACMRVYHVCAWYLWRSEETARCRRTGVETGREPPGSAGT